MIRHALGGNYLLSLSRDDPDHVLSQLTRRILFKLWQRGIHLVPRVRV
jgi:hypothetical protein